MHMTACFTADPDKVERGMQINLDHERFYTKATDCPHEAMEARQCLQCSTKA